MEQEPEFTHGHESAKQLLATKIDASLRKESARSRLGRWPLMLGLERLLACEEDAGRRFRGRGVAHVDASGRFERGAGAALASSAFKKTYRGFDVQECRYVAWNFVNVSSLSLAAKMNFLQEILLHKTLTAPPPTLEVRAEFDNRIVTFTETSRPTPGMTECELECATGHAPIWRARAGLELPPDDYPYARTRCDHEAAGKVQAVAEGAGLSSELVDFMAAAGCASADALALCAHRGVLNMQALAEFNARELQGHVPLANIRRLQLSLNHVRRARAIQRGRRLLTEQKLRAAEEDAWEALQELRTNQRQLAALGRNERSVRFGDVEVQQRKVKLLQKEHKDREFWVAQAQAELHAWDVKESRGTYISSSSDDDDDDDDDEQRGAAAARNPVKVLSQKRFRDPARGRGHVTEALYAEASSLVGLAHWEQPHGPDQESGKWMVVVTELQGEEGAELKSRGFTSLNLGMVHPPQACPSIPKRLLLQAAAQAGRETAERK